MKSGIQPILSRDIDNELQAHEARDTWVFRSYGGAIFVVQSISFDPSDKSDQVRKVLFPLS